MNRLTLSGDRRELTIHSPDGHRATLRSARPNGFTEADLDRARDFPVNSRLVKGQVNRARRWKLFGRTVYVHVNTGPPTWWIPKVRIKRREVMCGWLRALVAFSWGAS